MIQYDLHHPQRKQLTFLGSTITFLNPDLPRHILSSATPALSWHTGDGHRNTILSNQNSSPSPSPSLPSPFLLFVSGLHFQEDHQREPTESQAEEE